MAQNS